MANNRAYYNVSQKEMENLLIPMKFVLLNDPKDVSRKSWSPDLCHNSLNGKEVTELVYGCRVRSSIMPLTLRVYSGIWLSGESRDVGHDAIRIVLVWRDIEPYENGESDTPVIRIIGIEKRVNRITTWEKNLKKRILNWQEGMGPTCSQCHSPMVERHKNNDSSAKFWGCCRYPMCKKTMSISS